MRTEAVTGFNVISCAGSEGSIVTVLVVQEGHHRRMSQNYLNKR